MHSLFAESLNLSQVKNLATQIQNVQNNIAELYPVLVHWWGV